MIFSQKRQLFDRWSVTYDWMLPSVLYQAAHKRLLEFVELPDEAHVLDLGCGTARLFDRLLGQFPDVSGVGLDLSPGMLAKARTRHQNRPNLQFVEGNAEDLPFPENTFDGVFSTISFLHYPHPQQVLEEIGRVLTPQGRFYWVDITVREELQGLLPLSNRRVFFYSPRQRDNLAKASGLRCLGHHYLLGFVLLTILGHE
ncbi:class I SAM-dependent methyltransferase [Spirulina sp. CS-785/01]|uniref:class I SAM-dependent methyltransferase n=1 Tax=Spirulina sp. CS-785/01 TaxID=3021716 RepID=UPI00232B63CA|nr:class I SAM-dependent methyltransferase [Spirulina sp. CS-785/01]MDB9314481.1 class I SAM-dependent methyltransferase [Spirulina sp. CS-785/01]